MAKKCILLVRVSTQIQDLDQQREAVEKAALSDGYKSSDIFIIEDKESATKLSENERNGLNRMKELIEKDPEINAVYCFEISRVSRRPEVLYSIRDYLIQKKVNLISLSPSFKILKDSGEFDTNTNVYFGLWTVFAENEGFNRKARFARGKAKAVANNKYIGGNLDFGYSVSENKDIIINQDEANIIRKAYKMLLSGNSSVCSIAKEFKELGIFKGTEKSIENKLCRIFHNKGYTGEKGKRYSLPMIITQEEYSEAQKIIARNKKDQRIKKDNIYFAKHLIFDKNSGYRMIANKSCISYLYDKSQVSINIVDSVLWHYTKEQVILMKIHGITSLRDNPDTSQRIEDCNTKIQVAQQNISRISEQIDNISERIILGRLSQEKGDSLIDRLILEKKESKKIIEQNKIILEGLNSQEAISYDLPGDDLGKQDLIRRFVEKVEYSRIDSKTIILEITRKYNSWKTEYKISPFNFKVQIRQENSEDWEDIEVEKLIRFSQKNPRK